MSKQTEEEVEAIIQPDEDDRGQILWLRGLTRLQQQVSCFKMMIVKCKLR